MAVLHTPVPTNAGELAFYQRVSELLGDDTHLWTELNSHTLGSGVECDQLLVAPNLGAFAIEVKAIVLDQIIEMGPATCEIRYPAGVQRKHPLEQARRGMNSLRNHLQKHANGKWNAAPFLKHCVAFPKISFEEFRDSFAASSQLMDQAEDWFLFSEDLESTEDLRRQLQHIYADRRQLPEPDQIDFLIAHLSIDGAIARKPQTSSADSERAKVAIKRIAEASKKPEAAVQTPRDRAYLGDSDPRAVIFKGAPGTGKTIELMRLALEHARQGRHVLFTCFNLVLASFLEGLLAQEEIGGDIAENIDIIPVGRLRALLAEDSEGAESLYDTVCVDESQDLTQEAFEDIETVAREDAHWFAADGPGQELYSEGTPATFLEAIRNSARDEGALVELKTSRRAASAALQIARSVRDIAPSTDKIPSWYATRAIQKRSDQGALDLDMEAVPDPAELIDVRFWDHPPGKNTVFEEVITELLERLDREKRPRDLAILVARTVRDEFNLITVRRVLDKLGVPYLDQTLDANKSTVLPEGHVRVVSYMSARGIEASRVLLLDLGSGFWETEERHVGEMSRAMLYVALTRGRLGTTVLNGPLERTKAYVEFLTASVREYERLMDEK
jgi:hypothetical protein